MATEYPDTKQSITLTELRDTLISEWIGISDPVLKKPGATIDEVYPGPKKESVCLAMAQWAIETGEGKKMVWYNLAGIKCKKEDRDKYDYTFTTTFEVREKKDAEASVAASGGLAKITKNLGKKDDKEWVEVTYSPKHDACCFRAFPTLRKGCEFFLKTIRDNYKYAWLCLCAGDLVGYVKALKNANYFTGDEDVYTARSSTASSLSTRPRMTSSPD
jgi:hypothetical protein